MSRILKYTVGTTPSRPVIRLSDKSKFLCARVQHDSVVLYFQDNSASDQHGCMDMMFALIHTGSFIDETQWQYVDTLMLDGGEYVLHLYLYK